MRAPLGRGAKAHPSSRACCVAPRSHVLPESKKSERLGKNPRRTLTILSRRVCKEWARCRMDGNNQQDYPESSPTTGKLGSLCGLSRIESGTRVCKLFNRKLSMGTAIWKGSITFGLVSIPIRLHAAARPRRIALHQLHTAFHVTKRP